MVPVVVLAVVLAVAAVQPQLPLVHMVSVVMMMAGLLVTMMLTAHMLTVPTMMTTALLVVTPTPTVHMTMMMKTIKMMAEMVLAKQK
jgi:hypothetical protein